LLPEANARQNDQDRGDEQQYHYRGHDAHSRRRHFVADAVGVEPPGAAQHPVDVRADRASHQTGYQEKRRDADPGRHAFRTRLHDPTFLVNPAEAWRARTSETSGAALIACCG
jgi:hypothetical protein